MKVRGSVALVTGAGRGIGKAIATTLAKNGATVVLVSRTLTELENVRDEIKGAGGEAIPLRADVTREADVAGVFREIEGKFKRLDILVNNAGVGRFAPVKDLRVEDFDEMWNLNVRGVFLCTQKAVPLMQNQRSGCIVNISSLAGKNALVNGAGYAATKWALMGFSNSLRLEVREFNVRVITICPGSVDTSFSPTPKDPGKSGKILHPEDVADTLLAAISVPDRAMVSEIDIRPTNPK